MLPCRPQEHHVIDRDICDLAVCCDLAGIGQDIGLLYMIVLVLHECAQRAVDGVVLAGLDLDRHGGQAVVIVDQIIDLAFVAVIVIKQLAAVSGQLLGHHAFIHGAEINPRGYCCRTGHPSKAPRRSDRALADSCRPPA